MEDVSFLLASFLDFFKENPFEISFLEAAKSLCLFIEEEFLDVNDKSTSYFDSPKDSIGLLKRSKNTVDHVLPSPSAIHLLNLKKLSFYFLEKDPNFANICQKKAEGLYQTLLFDLHAAWQGKISSFLAVKEYEQLKFFLKINAPKNQYQEFQNFLIKENKWNPSSFVCTVSSNPHKKSSLSLCTDKLCLFECNFPMTDMQKKEILEII